MSGRYHDHNKGSSRSTRDDSRTHKVRAWEGRSRDRSRSPRRRHSPAATSQHNKHSPEKTPRSRDKEYVGKTSKKSSQWDLNSDSEEDVPAPPPPPRISKITMGFSKPKAPIKMNIGGPAKTTAAPKPSVASVFNDDDEDDEPEEMPAEAKMRMRNIGRETPTSAGPNSFGKTKQGFCDAKKVFEKNMKQALDTADHKPAMHKFPQTIYKISGP